MAKLNYSGLQSVSPGPSEIIKNSIWYICTEKFVQKKEMYISNHLLSFFYPKLLNGRSHLKCKCNKLIIFRFIFIVHFSLKRFLETHIFCFCLNLLCSIFYHPSLFLAHFMSFLTLSSLFYINVSDSAALSIPSNRSSLSPPPPSSLSSSGFLPSPSCVRLVSCYRSPKSTESPSC